MLITSAGIQLRGGTVDKYVLFINFGTADRKRHINRRRNTSRNRYAAIQQFTEIKKFNFTGLEVI